MENIRTLYFEKIYFLKFRKKKGNLWKNNKEFKDKKDINLLTQKIIERGK